MRTMRSVLLAQKARECQSTYAGLLGKQCKYVYMHITTEVLSCIFENNNNNNNNSVLFIAGRVPVSL